MEMPRFEYSEAHKKLLAEGFEPLGMYENVKFGTQEKAHTVPPLQQIVEDSHLPFRILPAHIAITNAPEGYEDRHIVYVPGGFKAHIDLLKCGEGRDQDR